MRVLELTVCIKNSNDCPKKRKKSFSVSSILKADLKSLWLKTNEPLTDKYVYQEASMWLKSQFMPPDPKLQTVFPE